MDKKMKKQLIKIIIALILFLSSLLLSFKSEFINNILFIIAYIIAGYNVVFIADDANETDGSKCLLVRIGDITEFKNEAKLEGHPERIGMMIYAQGVRKNNIYGLPGVRDLNAYKVGE